MTVNGIDVVFPSNTVVQLPAAYLTPPLRIVGFITDPTRDRQVGVHVMDVDAAGKRRSRRLAAVQKAQAPFGRFRFEVAALGETRTYNPAHRASRRQPPAHRSGVRPLRPIEGGPAAGSVVSAAVHRSAEDRPQHGTPTHEPGRVHSSGFRGTAAAHAPRWRLSAVSAILATLQPEFLFVKDITLIKPSLCCLAEYTAALERGWSPDNVRGAEAAREQLGKVADDPLRFVASLDDPDAAGEPVRLPDGSSVPRLPGYHRWIWDGAFCGSIGFRWQRGTSVLPPHVLGHIGFAVVPWKRNMGYARRALTLMLPEARKEGLPYVELTADPGNVASQRVIQACGGVLVERFQKTAAYGGSESLRFRIELLGSDDPTARPRDGCTG